MEWPKSGYPKLFIYTRRFPALEELLKYVSRSELSALVYSEEAIPRITESPGRGRLQYSDRPFDLNHAAAACDLAITNGNHGTTAAMLLAGKPVLVIPTVAEQYMLGQRVEALGARRLARPDHLDAVIEGLLTLLRDQSIRECALRFKEKYSTHDSDLIVYQIVVRLEELAR